MTRRKLAGAGAAFGAATTVAALLLGAATATAAEPRPEKAFALAADGLVPLGPITPVASPNGDRVYDELIGLSKLKEAEALGIEAGLLTAEARLGYATSSVAHLKVADLLRGDLIKTTCDRGKGKVEIVDGALLGRELPKFPQRNQKVDVSPLVKATLGEETRNPDGSITVTGIKLTVLPAKAAAADDAAGAPAAAAPQLPDVPVLSDLLETAAAAAPAVGGAGGLQTVTIGSATCAPVDGDADGPGRHDDDDDGDDNGDDGGKFHHRDHGDEPDADDAPEAPKPDVVEADLPVTG